MTRARLGGAVPVLLAAVLLASGCAATARPKGLNSHLIRPAAKGSPSTPAPYDVGPTVDSLETVIGKIRELSARARPVPKQVPGVTIESVDQQLQAAVLAVHTWPSATTHRRLAAEYVRVGVLDAAFGHYRAALRFDAGDGAAYDGLARIWRDWKLPALAMGDARRAVYHAPHSPEVYNTLGTVFQALGRRADAKKAYKRSLELNPAAAYALNNLGYVALLERDRAAVQYFRRAIVVDATLVAARHNLALAYAALGRLDLARHELRQADSPAAADYNLGIIQLARRDEAAARAAFAAACEARAGIRWACERHAALKAAEEPGGTP